MNLNLTNITSATEVTTEVADMFLEAKRMVEEAEGNLAAARDLFLSLGGGEAVASDGTRVKTVVQERTSYDLERLASHVDDSTMERVVKVSVDASKVRKAVEMGLIPSEVAEFAGTITEVTTVRVYPVV